jgi:hypothetical protein
VAESREDVERALAELGWEVSTDGSGAVMGGHGKYHLMVGFQDGEPVSVTISYVGAGGEILSRAWPGTKRLPAPRSVVRRLRTGSKE